MPDTAVTVREEQHPLVAQIDARMPEIAEILPDGMDPKRFRKVVVQALLRNPALWSCTPVSVVTAITEAAEVGIEPTGVLGKGWLVPYKHEAKFIPGWRGFVDLLWRADRLLVTPELVRTGDEFGYRRGTDAFLHHVPLYDDPDREADDANVTHAYVIVRFPDGRTDFEVMSRKALDRIRDKSASPIWKQHPGEMMKKTPIRRIAKRLPLSPAAQRLLAGDEEVDYDTAVERVPNPKSAGLRERISARTAAMRGDDTEESDAEAALSGAVPEDEVGVPSQASSSGGSSAKGDPWMRKIHALGAERGMDHDGLHDWAVQHFRVGSLSELDTSQRATFTELIENMGVAPDVEPSA